MNNKILNKNGIALSQLKWNILTGNIHDYLVSIIVAPYSDTITKMLIDPKLTLDEFQSQILKISQYILTDEESKEYKNNRIIKEYDDLLSLKRDKFTLKIKAGNIIVLEKYYRINNNYWINYMGTDLNKLKQSALWCKKNPYNCLGEDNQYAKELDFFKNFIVKKSYVIFNEIKDILLLNNIIPAYERYKFKNKPIIFSYNILDDKIITFTLSINTDIKNRINENVNIMSNVLDKIEEITEKHLNMNLYKS